MPIGAPGTLLQLAFVPHSSAEPAGEHVSAQYFEPVGLCSAHIGVAVQPAGKSVGQELSDAHLGTHMSPAIPSICTCGVTQRSRAERVRGILHRMNERTANCPN